MENVKPILDFFKDLKSPFPQVYINIPVKKEPQKKPVILLTGFSGSGKDTVLKPIFDKGNAYHVVTGTTRKKREGTSEKAHVWFRGKKLFESKGRYIKNLVKEYELIEHDFHYGNLYGLPLSSLKKEGSGIPVIRTDIHGVETLQKVLPKYGYQGVSIAVMPDTWAQVYESILKRKSEGHKAAEQRLNEDIESSDMYSKYINYFLHNTRGKVGEHSGLEKSVEGLEYILSLFV
jgi:guanylate kinase